MCRQISPSRQLCGSAVLLALFVFSGCSLPPFNQLGGTSGAHRLTETAKALRAQATEPQPLPRELDKRVSAPITVEPGDVLLVQPADIDSTVRLPGDQPILPDGTITLGRFGRLIVAGKTLDDIEVSVKSLVESKSKETVSITARLVSRQSKVYYVIGEVNAPGSFTFTGRETVLDAIMAAGGLTPRASLKNVTMSRPTAPDSCRIVLPICLRDIVQIGDTSTNYQLAAGDRIYVPSKTWQENMCGDKKECLPCGGPQTACVAGGACGPHVESLAPASLK